jgi:hypothetical protein
MLAPLRDPVTRVTRQSTPVRGVGGPIQTKWEAGSVLTITIPNSADWPDMVEKLRKARDDVRKVSAIVFDLREASETVPFALSMSGINRTLSSHIVSAPGERRRFHSGLASQSAGSGGYYSGFQVSFGERFEPMDNPGEKSCVFVVSERTYIPSIALALQATRRAGMPARS